METVQGPIILLWVFLPSKESGCKQGVSHGEGMVSKLWLESNKPVLAVWLEFPALRGHGGSVCCETPQAEARMGLC